MAVNQECAGCGRTTRHRLARGLCSWCYAQHVVDDPRPVDPNGLAWTTTRPNLAAADHTWWDRAACAGLGPDLFFPERGQDARPAKQVCADCPVADQCADYARANNIKFGTWGGVSEYERKQERSRRHRQAAAA